MGVPARGVAKQTTWSAASCGCHGCRALTAIVDHPRVFPTPLHHLWISQESGRTFQESEVAIPAGWQDIWVQRGNVIWEQAFSWEIDISERNVEISAHRTEALHQAVDLRVTKSVRLSGDGKWRRHQSIY
jgi:hypothetical protein